MSSILIYAFFRFALSPTHVVIARNYLLSSQPTMQVIIFCQACSCPVEYARFPINIDFLLQLGLRLLSNILIYLTVLIRDDVRAPYGALLSSAVIVLAFIIQLLLSMSVLNK